MANPARLFSNDLDDNFHSRALLKGESGVGSPAIDLVHLARQSLGDRALEQELLSLFDRQAAQIVAQFGSATAFDAKIARDLAHTLKGSARAIGAGRVAAAAGIYEENLNRGDADRGLPDLRNAVAEARAAIRDLLADQ